jgi:nucleotide-binding universal stress UspA family protein
VSAVPVEPDYAVVAVDGSEEGSAAVAFAAEEAVRQSVVLRIVHVMPAYLPVGPLLMTASDEGIETYASETLAKAVQIVREQAPQLEVTSHVLAGGRVSEVVALSDRAQFTVVGRRRGSALDRAWSGGTMDGIVSRGRGPVFVVPRVKRGVGVTRRVVLGFKSAAHADELFAAGFQAAEELGAELELIHAWKLSSGYDDIIARRVSEATWNRDQKAALWGLLAPWIKRYPHVPVRVEVVHEHPVRALVEASRDADRLVLVKPLHGSAVHHLGRTARGTLRCAQCPVEVVAARHSDEPTTRSASVELVGDLVP